MALGLTRREVEVLNLVKLGHTDKEIASDLGLSVESVKTHLQLIFAKLQARNRVDAVIKALRAGYLQLNSGDSA